MMSGLQPFGHNLDISPALVFLTAGTHPPPNFLPEFLFKNQLAHEACVQISFRSRTRRANRTNSSSDSISKRHYHQSLTHRSITMDTKPLPGAFILGAADYGLKAASILTSFAPSRKSKDLASKLSISATVLSEVGKEVNKNASCFKENFQKTFEHVPMKCQEKYEKVLAALEKASSFTKREPPIEGIVIVNIPQTPWSRFLSELHMDKHAFRGFQESLDQAWLQALMLQYIVSLVVLQIRAQKYVSNSKFH
jgi:hypothetical protein